LRREYVKASYVIPKRGLRFFTAKIIKGRSVRSGNVVYPREGDRCSEEGFSLSVVGRHDELRLYTPSESPRRLKRFLRDYAKSTGGLPRSVSFWRVPWR